MATDAQLKAARQQAGLPVDSDVNMDTLLRCSSSERFHYWHVPAMNSLVGTDFLGFGSARITFQGLAHDWCSKC